MLVLKDICEEQSTSVIQCKYRKNATEAAHRGSERPNSIIKDLFQAFFLFLFFFLDGTETKIGFKLYMK